MNARNHTRRDFLKTVGLAAAALSLWDFGRTDRLFAEEATRRGLSFVFILIDDLGWMDTGCYGSKFYKTPNIDKRAV